MIYYLTCLALKIIFKCFFGLEILGKENLPKQGAFIIASNHCSHLDPPIIGAACFGKPLSYFAKEELFRHPLFAWYIRTLHAFPVRRSSGDISAFKESLRRLRNGDPLVMFPEGTRSKDGLLQSGQQGVAMLATKTGLPVVPAYITGSSQTLSPSEKRFRRCKLFIRFGSPIIFDDATQSYEDKTARLMSAIQSLS